MSSFPPSDSPAQNNPAFAAAVERAQQVASKLKSSSDSVGGPPVIGGGGGIKRPLGDPLGGPDNKRVSIGGGGMDGGLGGGAQASEEINVPDKMVGMIIGRGGEQITKLQAESGCKIQMAPDSGGLPERLCTLSGSAIAIGKAKAMITAIIAGGEMKAAGGGHMGGGGGGPGVPGGFYETMVPGHKVGLIIGKGGETIKMLQEQTGAKIAIIQESAEQADQKPLRISGQPQAVEMAKARVNELLSQGDGQNGFGGRGGRGGRGGPFQRGMPPGRGGPMMGRGRGRGGGAGWPSGFDNGNGEKVELVSVPSNKVGLVIGKGGETIKSINQTSGAHCEVDKRAPPDAPEKSFVIKGSPEAVEKAKQMVLEKIGMAPGGNYGSFPGQAYGGGGGGGYNGQQQGYQPQQNPYQSAPAAAGGINPSTGQPDYSAQWAEYYRSLGMMREADMVEQQAAAAAPQPAPAAPTSQPQGGAPGGGVPDYSTQWVDYYRSVGKIREAEAIEAQIRARGGQPAGHPAAAAAPAQMPGQQPGYAVQGYYPPQQPQGGYPGYE